MAGDHSFGPWTYLCIDVEKSVELERLQGREERGEPGEGVWWKAAVVFSKVARDPPDSEADQIPASELIGAST